MEKKTNKLASISQINRPVMGDQVPLLVFRAFRHFSADYVEQKKKKKGADLVFQNGGREMGREVGASLKKPDFDEYLAEITKFVAQAHMGKLRLVRANDEEIVLALDECLTCAGMPNIGKRICHFEVGLVAGVVEAFVGHRVQASETKCYANGEETCEVTVKLPTK